MAVTEQQVKVFMAKRAEGQSQATAAAQAGLAAVCRPCSRPGDHGNLRFRQHGLRRLAPFVGVFDRWFHCIRWAPAPGAMFPSISDDPPSREKSVSHRWSIPPVLPFRAGHRCDQHIGASSRPCSGTRTETSSGRQACQPDTAKRSEEAIDAAGERQTQLSSISVSRQACAARRFFSWRWPQRRLPPCSGSRC